MGFVSTAHQARCYGSVTVTDESFTYFYSSARDHHHANGGHPARWCGGLHAVAGFGVARGGLSDHSSNHVLSWRKPRRDGVIGDRSARTSVRAGARTPTNDLHQFRWKLGDHASIQPQFEY